MSEIKIKGTLKAGDKKYGPGHEYLLEVARKSGNIDTLLVLIKPDGDEQIPTGPVSITGSLKAEYIHGLGVPAYIAPEHIDAISEEELKAGPVSEAVVTGRIKSDIKCRKTRGDKIIASMLLKTEDGMIPVILWGGNAKKAEANFKAGMSVTITGRMQSREYPNPKGEGMRTTYELSAVRMEAAKEGE